MSANTTNSRLQSLVHEASHDPFALAGANYAGSPGPDFYQGGDNDDTISGLGGNDTLYGGLGVDTITGGEGDDYILGGRTTGSDYNSPSDGADRLSGEAGNDSIRGSYGDDKLFGGDGDDNLRGDQGADRLDGGAGHDLATYRFDDRPLTTGVVFDVSLVGTADVVRLNDGWGSIDTLISIESTVITDTQFADTITGSMNYDQITITGGNGDLINAGGGDDVVFAYNGVSTINLQDGDDIAILDDRPWYFEETVTAAYTLDGGIGTDTAQISWTTHTNAITASLTAGGVLTASDGGAFTVSGTNFEILYFVGGSAGDTATGSNLADEFYGNGGADTFNGGGGKDFLDGGAGADTLTGGAGDDTYLVDDAGDKVRETLATDGVDEVFASVSYKLTSFVENLTLTGTGAIDGTGNSLNNVISGNELNNTLDGGAGNDRLLGGGGTDTLIGGAGDDTYIVDDETDVVREVSAADGVDTVESSASRTLTAYIENLTLTGDADAGGTGNSQNNVILGNDGDNMLDGKAGADTMMGGNGDDTYNVDNVGDIARETSTTGGVDTVQSTITWQLTANIENLRLLGLDAIDATGNSLGNVLTGNSGINTLTGLNGDDILDGRGGADTMVGGAGNDGYVVDNVGDIVRETSAADGVDTVQSSISYKLTANVENLTLTGTGNIEATGTSLTNVLIGNDKNNAITGGGGADSLTGGLGVDRFIYKAVSDSSMTAFDIITDLTDSDRIDLSAVDANTATAGDQAFAIVSAFTHVAGQMTLAFNAGFNLTTVQMDVNGDGAADMQIVLTGDHTTYTNFIF